MNVFLSFIKKNSDNKEWNLWLNFLMYDNHYVKKLWSSCWNHNFSNIPFSTLQSTLKKLLLINKKMVIIVNV